MRDACTVHIRPAYPTETTLFDACHYADAILARLGAVTAGVIEAAPRLWIIARHGAGSDAVDLPEPLAADSPLRCLRNVVLSPHVAGRTRDAVVKVGLAAAQAILDELTGRRPEFVVNPDAYAMRASPD